MQEFTLPDTQLFIDSGWNVIPYDSIRYNEQGKKIASPPIQWSQFIVQKNTKVSKAGALICGEQLVIDCDSNESTLEILKLLGYNSLDAITQPDFSKKVGLVVKTDRGYHFYFNGDSDIHDWKGNKLDIQATNKKLIYLPTEASERKTIVNINLVANHLKQRQVILLHDLPKPLKQYLLSLKDSYQEIQSIKTIRYTSGTPLAKIEKGTINFWKRLTPNSFREIPYFRGIIDDKGYLEPTDIVQGYFNSYLVSIAGILTTDSTIDINKFWDILRFIHSKFKNPIPFEELEDRVRGYTENKYPNIPFVYDEDWDKQNYSFIDTEGNEITILYDLNTSKYIIAYLNDGLVWFKNPTDVSSFYANRMGQVLSANKIASIIPSTNVICDPNLPFGITDDKEFNTFKKSKWIELLTDNSSFSAEEKYNAKNCNALKFLEHLLKEQKDYFLRFLKTKLLGFKYSPVSLYLFDVEGGAGKGVFEVYLSKLCGEDKVVNMPYETFKSKFTSDLENKLFVFLNEYPDDYKARKVVTDKLKDLTGSPITKIEKKGRDPYSVKNIATYVVTSNRLSLEIKEGDRRFFVVQCDMKFNRRFKDGFFDSLLSDDDMKLFIIYLKYFVDVLPEAEYMEAPLSKAKHLFIDVQETNIDKIVRAFINKDWEFLRDTYGKDIFNRAYDVIFISRLAALAGVSTRTLTSVLKTRQDKVFLEFEYDSSRKFSQTTETIVRLPSGSLKDLIL